jgi:hypothetical protein
LEAHRVKRSSKDVKGIFTNTSNGIGVVPPVPKINNKVNDKPKKISFAVKPIKIYGKRIINTQGIKKTSSLMK